MTAKFASPGKADFSAIYNKPDPRAYYQALAPYTYVLPQHAATYFRRCIDALSKRSAPVRVVDLCCGYGVNGALLGHELTMSELYARYACDPWMAEASSDEIVDADRYFFESKQHLNRGFRMIGVDAAERAVRFARQTNLIDQGLSIDLENNDLTNEAADLLADADLVTVTGGVGYIGANTFGRLTELWQDRLPWFAFFASRYVNVDGVLRTLNDAGLKLEFGQRPLPHRKFVDNTERAYVLDELEAAGKSTDLERTRGMIHSRFFLARPPADAKRMPIGSIVDGQSAGNAGRISPPA